VAERILSLYMDVFNITTDWFSDTHENQMINVLRQSLAEADRGDVDLQDVGFFHRLSSQARRGSGERAER